MAATTTSPPTDPLPTTTPAPIVTTPRILIRPWSQADAEDMHKAANNLKVARYMTLRFPSPHTLASAEEWITLTTTSAATVGKHFAICLQPEGTPVGGIGLTPPPGNGVEPRTRELGYWLGEAAWGQGLATEAVTAFTRWAFSALGPEEGLRRIDAWVFGGNEASGRVLTKAGFVLEGRRRKAGFKFGEEFDIVLYGLLREELPLPN
ncbi:acyl-CoA N-acyltransferase [Podospora didyma]|uniref:Acyl-CoA N-acyltransferase n=1 Tax=Podospora didyma TaxID=330526 RepID=A0AAE0U7A4_9PEZI|nr:acyl-CoA N-acyltransferase [Podospora didyma]